VSVCHFPPGTSKWNKIEHRLFSHITMNWRGRPLTSHEVIVNTIAATTTRAGLTVRAGLDPGSYPGGVKVSDEQMAALPLDRHDWHGDWNYTLRPEPPAPPPPPAPPARQPQRPDWAHPALTGLGASAWNQMITALAVPYQAHHEAGLYIRRGGPPTRKPAGGHPPALTLAEKTLATVLRQRFQLPLRVLATLFGTAIGTISTAEHQIQPLLTQAGYHIQPAGTRLSTLPELTAYASAHGVTLTPKPKPAR
jgi:Rhodopirellula transposase DDE domain